MKTVLCVALFACSAFALSGCSGDDPSPEQGPAPEITTEQKNNSAATNAPSTTTNDGPQAVEAQCADCMISFDKARMKEIEGRWYCESCAAKKG